MSNKRKIGKKAEDFAQNYLIKLGWTIIERNYFCTVGEIDIIANDGTEVVFVEVRSTFGESNGRTVYELITPAKLSHIKRSVNFWLMEHNFNKAYRVDYLGLEHVAAGEYNLQHFKNL